MLDISLVRHQTIFFRKFFAHSFQIFINDERFCTYAHRLEPHDLHGLQIGGDVEITGIQIF